MNFVISPGARTGAVRIPASKSQAHRLLICAALGKAPVTVRCDGLNADILATAACLRALGANIAEQDGALCVELIREHPLLGNIRRRKLNIASVFNIYIASCEEPDLAVGQDKHGFSVDNIGAAAVRDIARK